MLTVPFKSDHGTQRLPVTADPGRRSRRRSNAERGALKMLFDSIDREIFPQSHPPLPVRTLSSSSPSTSQSSRRRALDFSPPSTNQRQEIPEQDSFSCEHSSPPAPHRGGPRS